MKASQMDRLSVKKAETQKTANNEINLIVKFASRPE